MKRRNRRPIWFFRQKLRTQRRQAMNIAEPTYTRTRVVNPNNLILVVASRVAAGWEYIGHCTGKEGVYVVFCRETK